ncbi:MAG: hypothetical protein RL514_2500 [Verrucomicrobiota bacterium]|jgi:hypothetical protein
MVLYKCLQQDRLDVLERRRIRFTQPGDFNDPFEFRPFIERVATDEGLRKYVGDNFERLVDEELAKYGALVSFVPQAPLKALLQSQKARLPELFRLLESEALQKVSPAIDSLLNTMLGVLCLSKVMDSLLMWGHYADNHQGFVVGFDSDHSFFNQRRTEQDEFGFLRRVNYVVRRPRVVLSDTSSPVWFQSKPKQWAYEKEWRIVRVLAEAEQRIERIPFPVCLFQFPAEAVVKIIIGMRSPAAVKTKIRSLAATFPRAALLQAREDPCDYRLKIEKAA